jgi:flagellar biosynthesis/type III secretory pathway protein FliH
MTEFEKGFEEGYKKGYQQAMQDIHNPVSSTIIHDPGEIDVTYEEAYGASVIRHINKNKE